MNETTKQAILSAVRSVLVVIGSLLTGHGIVDDQTFQSILGAVMVIVPLVWGVADKVLAEAKAQSRELSAVQAGVAAARDTGNNIVVPADVMTKQDAQTVIKNYS